MNGVNQPIMQGGDPEIPLMLFESHCAIVRYKTIPEIF